MIEPRRHRPTRWARALLLAAGAATVLGACGPTSTATPPTSAASGGASQGPTSAPAPSAAASVPATTPAELDAVARRIFPGPNPSGCAWRDRAGCPITDRLAARIEQLQQPVPGQAGTVAPFCRCQNGGAGLSVQSEAGPAGGVAHVRLDYGGGTTVGIDLIVVRTSSGLLVDDTQCTGRGPSTSIYSSPLAAC